MAKNPILNAQGDALTSGGEQDPTVTALDLDKGSLYIFAPRDASTPRLYQKQDDGESTSFSETLTAATGAAVDLSNLTAPTAVPVDLLPDTDCAHDLGSSSLRWDNVYSKVLDAGAGFNVTLKSGNSCVDVDTSKIINLVDPVAPQEAVTKNYADTTFASISHTHDAADVVSGTFVDARIAQSNVTQHVAAIDHDSLLNFVGNEHVDHTAVSITGDDSLTGGGDLTSSSTISLVNDAAAPGNSMYYGTDGGGTKGFFALPSGGDLWSDDIDSNITLDANETYELGTSSVHHEKMYTRKLDFSEGSSVTAQFFAEVSGFTTFAGTAATWLANSTARIASPNIGGGGTTQAVQLGTGNQSGTGLSGNIDIKTGDASGNDSGNIGLETGTSSGTRGTINLVDGSEGTVGHVWTSTGTGGEGNWAAPSGGGDAWSDPIDSNITVDTDNTYDIGTFSARIKTVWSDSFFAINSAATTGVQVVKSFTTPSAVGGVAGLLGVSATPLQMATANSGAPDAVATAAAYIETGNKTAGTGASGKISLQTGTSSGGQSGDVKLITGTSASGSATGSITFDTGDQTAGAASTGSFTVNTGSATGAATGSTGNINLITGTAASGTRGHVNLIARALRVPTNSADPSSPLDGFLYYNTTTDKLRLRAAGAWVDLN